MNKIKLIKWKLNISQFTKPTNLLNGLSLCRICWPQISNCRINLRILKGLKLFDRERIDRFFFNVTFFNRADAGHGVHVEVHAQEEGLDGDVSGVGGDVVVGETDGYEAGEIFEGGFKLLAESAWV